MLRLPGNLDVEQFLARYWQKKPLLMPQALPQVKPAVTRNELAWLATQDDVESRIVFTDRSADGPHYRADSGPFDEDYLAALPARDWTLLVHDVEKHLPTMRRLFRIVPFIPDWRIDDLMVSFAAPGGGVGPHRDNYDVFLCQGVGVRDWHVTTDDVDDDPGASNELSLTREFRGELHSECRNGDVLYLPPGVAHWGTARRACLTYSIGMRAPQRSDLEPRLSDRANDNPFYVDADLGIDEARPGYVAAAAVRRALRTIDAPDEDFGAVAEVLGRFATETKQWITPERPDDAELLALSAAVDAGKTLPLHGMARVAWSDDTVFVNGSCAPLPPDGAALLEEICERRHLRLPRYSRPEWRELAAWMAGLGAFNM